MNRVFAFVPFTPDVDVIDVLGIDGYHGFGIMSVPSVVKSREHIFDGEFFLGPWLLAGIGTGSED